jgi:hypothetical protein
MTKEVSMSIAHTNQPIAIPVFSSTAEDGTPIITPADVTPHIIETMRSPTMRSLAQTSKEWNLYLRAIWDLDLKNFNYAADSIAHSRTPSMKFIKKAEKLAKNVNTEESIKFIKFVLPDLKRNIRASNTDILLTILSSKLGENLPGSLQQALSGITAWEEGAELDLDKFEQLVACSFSVRKGEKVPFNDVLKVCVGLPDRFKAVAFIALMEELCSRQGFNNDNGAFWKNEEVQGSEFLSLLPELLPKTWNPLLAMNGVHSFELKENIMFGKSSFGFAVQACLQKLGTSNPEFIFSILHLIISATKDLSPKNKTWSGLGKHLKKQKSKQERRLMKDLLIAATCWGMSDPDIKQKCKKILYGSGFMNLFQWASLEGLARELYLLKCEIPYLKR